MYCYCLSVNCIVYLLIPKQSVTHLYPNSPPPHQAAEGMDDYQRDLILDPMYEGKVYQADPLLRYQPRVSGRKPMGFRLLDVVGATLEDMTYRHVDLRSTCIAILSSGGVMPQQKMKRRIKSYFRIHPEKFPLDEPIGGSCTLYTASINWHTMSALTVTPDENPCLCTTGLMRYSSGKAYYRSASDALRAIMVRTMVKVAVKREGTGRDPLWSQRLLPKDRLHVVLYQNGNSKGNTDRIFGYLHFRKGKRVLSIPSDSQDLTSPWEDFTFEAFH